MSRLSKGQRTDLHCFILERLGERFDDEGRTGVGWAILFAMRHWWFGLELTRVERAWAARHYADHPDYREEWRP